VYATLRVARARKAEEIARRRWRSQTTQNQVARCASLRPQRTTCVRRGCSAVRAKVGRWIDQTVPVRVCGGVVRPPFARLAGRRRDRRPLVTRCLACAYSDRSPGV